MASLAFGLRLHTALAPLETQDERNWMLRTVRFSEALHSGDLEHASAVPTGAVDPILTLPGVTTMWVGTIARWIWSTGKALSLWTGQDDPVYGGGDTFANTRSGLQLAQVTVAATTAVLVGVLVFVVARWAGSRSAGAVAGVLVATEPFLVAHGAVFHTDELMTLFGVISLLLAALALGLPATTTSRLGGRRMAVLGGAFAGGALLTKVSAVIFIIGTALLFGWAMLSAVRRPDNDGGSGSGSGSGDRSLIGLREVGHRLRPVFALELWWAAGFVLATTLAYPALWFRPGDELRHINRTIGLADTGHTQFFRGETTGNPGFSYYLVATPLRSTPWLLVGALVALAALAWRRATRGHCLVLLLTAVPILLVLSTASKKFDRYGLPLLVVGAVAVGMASIAPIQALGQRSVRRFTRMRPRDALVGAAGLVALYSLAVSPSGLVYYNPLLGGSSVAEDTLLIGWGEGREEVGRQIEEHAGSCDDITVSGYMSFTPYYHCGKNPAPGDQPTYRIIAVAERQRSPVWYRASTEGRELVDVVRIRGLDYYEIFGPLDEPSPPPPALPGPTRDN